MRCDLVKSMLARQKGSRDQLDAEVDILKQTVQEMESRHLHIEDEPLRNVFNVEPAAVRLKVEKYEIEGLTINDLLDELYSLKHVLKGAEGVTVMGTSEELGHAEHTLAEKVHTVSEEEKAPLISETQMDAMREMSVEDLGDVQGSWFPKNLRYTKKGKCIDKAWAFLFSRGPFWIPV